MKKLFFVISILLTGSEFASEIDKEKTMAEIKRIETMMYTNPREAAIESAALALGSPTEKIRQLQKIDPSEIKDIRYIENDVYTGYIATLKNWDTVSAESFLSGPAVGTRSGTRSVRDSQSGYYVLIPLDPAIYEQLRAIYEAQNKNQS